MTNKFRLHAVALAVLALLGSGCHCGTALKTLSSDPAVLPTSLDFGTVPLAQTVHKTVTLQNNGSAPVVFTGAQLSGTNADDFVVDQSLFSIQLGAGAQFALDVGFAPHAVGSSGATLTISTDSDSAPSFQVALSGVGIDVQICAQPASLDFGPTQVKGTPVSRSFQLANCGKSAATVTLAPVEGAQKGDFTYSVAGDASGNLDPGAALTVTVTYSPRQLGPSTADVPWKACADCAAVPFPFTGTGVDGALTLSPNPEDFGTVSVSTMRSITATNSGTEPIVLTAAAIRGHASPFALGSSPTLPLMLAAGASTAFPVTFTPGASGQQTDDLDVAFKVADPLVAARTVTAVLAATAPVNPCTLQIAPVPLNFGNVAPGSSAMLQLGLINSGGVTCHVSAVALAPGTDSSFSVGGPAALTIAAAQSASIPVTFAPTTQTPAQRTGTLTFATDDAAHLAVMVPLTGIVSKSLYAGGWPKWHADNTNSGRTTADTSHLTGTVAWTVNIGAPPSTTATNPYPSYMNSPVVGPDGTVYQLGMDGVLHAIDSAGHSLWTVQLTNPASDPHSATPIIYKDGSLFVETGADISGSTLGSLYHVGTDGGIIYNYPSPAGTDGFDVCPSLTNGGYLLDGDDVGLVASYQVNPNGSLGTVTSATAALPEVAERVGVVVAPDDSSYWCIGNFCRGFTAPASGMQTLAGWPSAGLQPAPDAPAAGIDYLGAADLSLDLATTGNLFVSVGWTPDLGHVQTELVALDPANGSLRWKLLMPSSPLPVTLTGWWWSAPYVGNGAPAVAADGTVYVGNGDGLYGVNGHTGAIKPGFPFHCGNVDSAPAIGGDGTVFFGSLDMSFYAVHPDGSLRFRIMTQGNVSSSPAIGPDGTVFFVSDDGKLYAVK